MSDESTCTHTPHVIADHLGGLPGSTATREAARHIAGCRDCQAELAALEPVTAQLRQWREQPVPAWNRRPTESAGFWRNPWLRWQWVPLAASVVLVLAVAFNVRVGVNEAGWSVSFGDTPLPAGNVSMEPETPLGLDAPVLRPDSETLRQSMALSLTDDSPDAPRSPGAAGGLQLELQSGDVTAFERQLYDALCRHGSGIRVPDGEHLTLLLSAPGGTAVEGGRPGGLVHVVDGAALRACQRGDIDIVALMDRSGRYSF